MTRLDFLASEISKRYGAVQRARGMFLYTRSGVRLTDLYREGGRAILGWRAGSAFTVFKNVMERGLVGSFDTDFTPRLSKAVCDLLAGERKIFVCKDKASALRMALSISRNGTSFWMPWNYESVNLRDCACVIIAPPFPWAGDMHLVAVNALSLSATADMPIDDVSASSAAAPDAAAITVALESISSERIPAPLSAAIARSIYDIIAAQKTLSEKDFFCYDTVLTKYWTRRGPYLYPKIDGDAYTDFITHCLDCGIVISPDANQPSLVPFGADKGIFTKLKNNPFAV